MDRFTEFKFGENYLSVEHNMFKITRSHNEIAVTPLWIAWVCSHVIDRTTADKLQMFKDKRSAVKVTE